MSQSHDAGHSAHVPTPVVFGDRNGLFTAPAGARSVILFAHGTGSHHQSPRNTHVATRLNRAGHATLLFDLVRADERDDPLTCCDTFLHAERIQAAIRWVHDHCGIDRPGIGLFGAGAGAGAALIAAGRAAEHDNLRAVVSRGGRPDLAEQWLAGVDCPTLFLVGERDSAVLGLNRDALQQMTCHNELRIIAGADRLFEGPGQIDQVADLTLQWFSDHLAA